MPFLEIKRVDKNFGPIEVLRGIDLSIEEHQVVCLIGPSGCGKSTLLRCINGLEAIAGGEIVLSGDRVSGPGVDVNRLRRDVGIVFQSFNLFPHMTVLDNVTLAPLKVLRKSRLEARAEAMALLDRIGMPEKAAEYPDRVSSIVLIGSTALPPVAPGTWLYDQVAALEFPLDRKSAFMREWHPSNQPTSVDPDFAEAVMEEILAIRPHVWRSVMRELMQFPVARHTGDVKARVLILSGGKDPLFPPEHHAALLKAFPNAKAQVFADLGHSPNWEQPEAVAAAIDEFLHSQNQGQAQ